MSQRDISKLLGVGETMPIQAAGDFIFLKESALPVRVLIDGQPIIMRAGDKRRLARNDANEMAFNGFEVENLSTTNPVQIVLVVGQGDYNSQIIHGTIETSAVTIGADGRSRPDTRFKLELGLLPFDTTIISYAEQQIIKIGPPIASDSGGEITSTNSVVFEGPDGLVVVGSRYNGFNCDLVLVDPDTLEEVSRLIGWQLVGMHDHENGVAQDAGWSPVLGYFKSYKSAIYQILGAGLAVENHPKAFDLPFQCTSVCWDFKRAGIWGLSETDGRLCLVDETGLLIYETTLTDTLANNTVQKSIRYDSVNDRIIGMRNSGGFFAIDPDTLQQIQVSTVSPPSPAYAEIPGFWVRGSQYITKEYLSGSMMYKLAFEPFDTKPELLAEVTGFESLYTGNPLQVTADFSVTESALGLVASGEMIKVVLENYFGRRLSANYLDHVYRVYMPRGSDGFPQLAVDTGNHTFEGELVVDDFSVRLPAKIEITIDNELALEGAL